MEVIGMIGMGLLVIGGIWFLIVAFQESLGWGFACLLLAPVGLVFLFKHWDEAKSPFFVQLGGLALVVVGAVGSS